MRSTQRYEATLPVKEADLRERIIALALLYGRYGYRRITVLLNQEGWSVNHKRVQRIWRQEGLKVAYKQKKRARLWLSDGSIIRKRPERPNHVWSYDFVFDRTRDGRKIRTLNVIDEYTRECLAIEVKRKLGGSDVIQVLSRLFLERGRPDYIRSDNGSEFTNDLVRGWLKDLQVEPLFITPASPWENGFCESFNARFRDELLNGEIFNTLREAQVIIENWRQYYNKKRPHSSLGYRPPAPETVQVGLAS